MSNDREAILSRVRGALNPLKQRAPLPDWEDTLIQMRMMRGEVDAPKLFAERLKLVNGTPVHSVAELVALLREKGWTHGYCDPALWSELEPAFAEGFTVETTFDRTRVDDYHFGITRASGAVAETGTLILKDRDTSSRLAALAPWTHIAMVKKSEIHPDLQSAVMNLGNDSNIIFCTGPSKTADVEGILIEGVHGPGVQVALIVE